MRPHARSVAPLSVAFIHAYALAHTLSLHARSFAPPLVITEKEVETAAGIIADAVYYFDKEHAARKM